MSIDGILGRLDRQTMVETIYLAARYLSHGLDRAGFERQLRSDIRTQVQPRAVSAVHAIIADIEAEFGCAVAALPGPERLRMIERLDDILARVVVTDRPDEATVAAALHALRQQA